MYGKIKTPEWIANGPMDYEYKSYKMFSELERLEKDLDSGKMFEVLVQVDDTLDYLYRYDAEKLTSLEDLTNYNLIGVDWQNFSLQFSQDPNINRDDIMDELCSLAIDKYEELHSKIRVVWRSIEDGIILHYIPNKSYFLSDGFAFIITPDNMLHTYYFCKPPKHFAFNWKDFKIEHIQTEKYTKEVYFKHVEELINAKTDKIIIKVECNNNVLIKGNAIGVIQHKIYSKLKEDYLF